MKKLLFCLLLLSAPLQAPAQGRQFNQAELDALLAPIALYPDALLVHVFAAATRPFDVGQAARWARSNPHLSGDDAVRAAHSWGWHSSVTALTAFPDILFRMEEDPQWLRDLGDAWMGYEPYVMETVQQLRRRAEEPPPAAPVVQPPPPVAYYPVAPPPVVHVSHYSPVLVIGSWGRVSPPPRPVHIHVHSGPSAHPRPHTHPKPHPRPQVNYPQRPQVQRPAPVAIQRPVAIQHRPQELRQYRSISRYVKEADHAIRTNPVRASVPQRNRIAPVGARSP